MGGGQGTAEPGFSVGPPPRIFRFGVSEALESIFGSIFGRLFSKSFFDCFFIGFGVVLTSFWEAKMLRNRSEMGSRGYVLFKLAKPQKSTTVRHF